ncbi:hypothetical protein BBB56_19925 [Candidatus Pantoea deserta]|uniref:Major royal jelly protein n=1 Tax=Candidatus Pantoea deserta TaxID=1869313 RepID=A0A3N4NHM4_9GAMM|nr:L-dopachrome tautomerase-related protein [Pantoea deserta]RPD95912.1 hypothetical protein BBB56_19925 [Pantoea deserta]
MAVQLRQVSTSETYLWNGVVSTPDGRIFASMPGWMGPTPGVVEINTDGSWQPFPDNEWNRWDGKNHPLNHFVDVNSIFYDGKGSLWVLDAAAPYFSSAIEGAVKLVQLDIETGKTLRKFVFDSKDAHAGTRLAHIRFWEHYAIMAESREGSFYIINLRDNTYRRILAGHELMRCRPDDVPVIEGRKVHLLNGQPMYIHNDLLEIHADNRTLLFMCLFGSRIFQIDLDIITDFSLSEEEISRHVTVFREVSTWIAGMCRDKRGNIYLTDAENNGISVMTPEGNITPVVRDERIIWPIAPSVGPDNCVYFPVSQLNRIPMFSGGEDNVARPWVIYSYPLEMNI